MNYKILIILIFFIFSGCKSETVNKKVNYDNNIYVNKGFTLIYSDELVKDKISSIDMNPTGKAGLDRNVETSEQAKQVFRNNIMDC